MDNSKQFKPFDKVLIRSTSNSPWHIDFYSHYDNKNEGHETIGDFVKTDIIPYEGNEHLVGTTDSPDEEVKLEPGEIIIVSDFIDSLNIGCGNLGRFRRTAGNRFCKESYLSTEMTYVYAIKFSDFNPNDMEETMKHILCVKNGKVVKYNINHGKIQKETSSN